MLKGNIGKLSKTVEGELEEVHLLGTHKDNKEFCMTLIHRKANVVGGSNLLTLNETQVRELQVILDNWLMSLQEHRNEL